MASGVVDGTAQTGEQVRGGGTSLRSVVTAGEPGSELCGHSAADAESMNGVPCWDGSALAARVLRRLAASGGALNDPKRASVTEDVYRSHQHKDERLITVGLIVGGVVALAHTALRLTTESDEFTLWRSPMSSLHEGARGIDINVTRLPRIIAVVVGFFFVKSISYTPVD